MKIVYILTTANHFGGAQVHVRDMAQFMRASGHKPVVLCGKPGPVYQDMVMRGLECRIIRRLDRPLRPLRDIRAFFEIRTLLKREAPDIVSCHSSKAGIIGRLAAFSLGIPAIFTAHGWSFTNGIWWRKRVIFLPLEQFCGMISSHIITVSRYDRALALRARIARPERITCIHNGVPDTARAITGKKYGIPVDLCMVARFSEQKDHETLLRALASLADRPWRLHLAGAGCDAACRALAQDLDLEDRIVFHGERTDIPALLSAMDMFILSSRWEGFPRSILEAMRAGLPVIATRTAGTGEAVLHGRCGLLVPRQNPHAMAAAVARLLDNPVNRARFGQEGRKRYERLFTFERMARRTAAVYETVLATGLRARPGLPERALRLFQRQQYARPSTRK